MAAAGRRKLDPAFRVNAGPIVELAAAAWTGWPTVPVINLALRAAVEAEGVLEGRWNRAGGPAAVFVFHLGLSLIHICEPTSPD